MSNILQKRYPEEQEFDPVWRDRALDESVLVTVVLLVQVANEYLLNDGIPKNFQSWRASSTISALTQKLSPSTALQVFEFSSSVLRRPPKRLMRTEYSHCPSTEVGILFSRVESRSKEEKDGSLDNPSLSPPP